MFTLLLMLSGPALADCTPVDLKRVNREARQLLDDLQPEKALPLVVQADENLGCMDLLVTPEDLATLYQVGGTAALRIPGEEAKARELFTAGARLAGKVSFDTTLGASAQSLYESQRGFVETQDRATVLAYVPARLDGLDLTVGQELAVAQGRHLVQRLDPSGAVSSSAEAVGAESPLKIGTPPEPPPGVVLPLAPAPKRHVGLAATGGLLIVAGGAAVIYGGVLKNYLGDDPTVEPNRGLVDALTFGGAGAIGAGTGVMFGAALLDSDSLTLMPTILVRW